MPSRNVNTAFAMNPINIDIQRSTFYMPHEVKTSFNVGDLIPFEVQEVLPGDTFRVSTSKVVRMQPLVSAPYDNLYLDTFYFYCPSRLLWEHWREFCGENNDSAWIPQVEYSIPMMEVTNASPGSILDYMGVPTKLTDTLNINELPIRAYALICNEWFRNENLTPPLNLDFSDTGHTAAVSTDQDYNDNVISVMLGGAPFKCAKFRDYFTSCLPGPQKGPDVAFSLTNPVYYGDRPLTDFEVINDHDPVNPRVSFLDSNGDPHSIIPQTLSYNGQSINTNPANSFQPFNMFVDTEFNVNSMRLAFQIQKLYEKEARAGSRYVEILKGHFSVTAPDASLQRPQYLGGAVRIPIQINQVLQTSESGSTPQGNVAGYSLTSDVNYDFDQSFTEHGYIIGVMVARYQHTYQQGLNRMWSRKDKLDFYWPVLSSIGEQPVLNQEIYALGTTSGGDDQGDTEVFGYQEAWADYRYRPNIVTGEMRSNVSNSLDSWHFADDYNQRPALSDSWIREDKSNIDRVLAVSSNVSNQLFADILIDMKATRPMPLYSIPGLIDHH